MLVNFTNFLGIACIFLQHINHCLGRFFPLGGSQLEALDRPFTIQLRISHRRFDTTSLLVQIGENIAVRSRIIVMQAISPVG